MVDQPLRVLLVRAEASGGIARHVGALADRLPALGIDVATAGPGEFGELRNLIRTVDVVHAHGVRAGVRAASARRGTSAKLVVTWHNAPLVTGLRRVAHQLASGYVARRADVTLGASPDLVEAARRAGARDARDTFVVAPALAAPTRDPATVRADLGVADRPLVLAVGRLQRQKRFDVLIAAAARWAQQPAGPVVAIAGSGPEDAALRSLAATAGGTVLFLGARADIADLLAAADVVALPSAWEARSLVAQETLRAGAPLVTTRTGGLPDLVGDAAVVVPVGNVDALGEAIDQVLGDRDIRDRLASAGPMRAATWPTADDAVATLVSTYRELVADSS